MSTWQANNMAVSIIIAAFCVANFVYDENYYITDQCISYWFLLINFFYIYRLEATNKFLENYMSIAIII